MLSTLSRASTDPWTPSSMVLTGEIDFCWDNQSIQPRERDKNRITPTWNDRWHQQSHKPCCQRSHMHLTLLSTPSMDVTKRKKSILQKTNQSIQTQGKRQASFARLVHFWKFVQTTKYLHVLRFSTVFLYRFKLAVRMLYQPWKNQWEETHDIAEVGWNCRHDRFRRRNGPCNALMVWISGPHGWVQKRPRGNWQTHLKKQFFFHAPAFRPPFFDFSQCWYIGTIFHIPVIPPFYYLAPCCITPCRIPKSCSRIWHSINSVTRSAIRTRTFTTITVIPAWPCALLWHPSPYTQSSITHRKYKTGGNSKRRRCDRVGKACQFT